MRREHDAAGAAADDEDGLSAGCALSHEMASAPSEYQGMSDVVLDVL
jgi:hypothetical protein